MDNIEMFTKVALERHSKNLSNFGQWEVLDDGVGHAKIQTLDQQQEYLVHRTPPGCNYFELQDMIWPCKHIMVWQNHDGRDYTPHFHACWKVSLVTKLYKGILPCFLFNNLEPVSECSP